MVGVHARAPPIPVPPPAAPLDDEALLRSWARAHPDVRPAAKPRDPTTCRAYRHAGLMAFAAPLEFAGSGASQLDALVEAMRACKRIEARRSTNEDDQFKSCTNIYYLLCQND